MAELSKIEQTDWPKENLFNQLIGYCVLGDTCAILFCTQNMTNKVSIGGQKPQERGSNRPTRYSEALRSKVGGTKRSSPVRVGIGRQGSLWLQLINYDFLSA